MRHIRLHVWEDRATGDLGFLAGDMRPMEDYPTVMDGRGIAHDLIEHQNGLSRIGSVDDELEALGAVWLVRGQWGDLSRDNPYNIHSAETNIGFDLMSLAEIYASGVGFRTPVPNTREHSQDDAFESIIDHGRRMVRSEHGRDLGIRAPESFYEDALHYMRSGYNKAQRRFKGNAMAANALFWSIAEAVQDAHRCIEYEGQEFRLSYGNGRAYCTEIHEEVY